VGTDEHEPNAYMAHHVWACECAYGAFRRRQPFGFVNTPKLISLVPPLFRKRERAFNAAEYKKVCRNFGLDLVHSDGETGNRYTQLHNVQLQKPQT